MSEETPYVETLGAAHDEMTRLANAVLRIAREGELAGQLADVDVIVHLERRQGPRGCEQGVSASIRDARSAADAHARIAISLARMLGRMLKDSRHAEYIARELGKAFERSRDGGPLPRFGGDT